MARDIITKKFYNSKAWKDCRASFISKRIAIDGGMCMTCHKELGYIVHHDRVWINPENINNPDVTLNHNNLKYDCLICHNQEKEGEQEQPRYVFGANGEVILIKPREEED